IERAEDDRLPSAARKASDSDPRAIDPRVDRSRIAVTGLPGGGWQTIVLSSLDARVFAAIPVAGFCSLTTAIEHPEYAGDDAEQNASDFRQGTDYAQLVAMRAPRPTF